MLSNDSRSARKHLHHALCQFLWTLERFFFLGPNFIIRRTVLIETHPEDTEKRASVMVPPFDSKTAAILPKDMEQFYGTFSKRF